MPGLDPPRSSRAVYAAGRVVLGAPLSPFRPGLAYKCIARPPSFLTMQTGENVAYKLPALLCNALSGNLEKCTEGSQPSDDEFSRFFSDW